MNSMQEIWKLLKKNLCLTFKSKSKELPTFANTNLVAGMAKLAKFKPNCLTYDNNVNIFLNPNY